MRRLQDYGLSFGTSPERNAPESLTPSLSGFVHRNISRLIDIPQLDQVLQSSTRAVMPPKSWIR